MKSVIKLNTRNEVLVADRIVGRLESPFAIDTITRVSHTVRLVHGMEQDYSGDSALLYKKVRDHVAGVRRPLFGGGFRRSESTVSSARTSPDKSRFRGFRLTDASGGMGVIPHGSHVGAPGGKLMRAEDWRPGMFGGNSELFLAGMLASRRMTKRFDFTAMGMVPA